jgi:hypothetical protein
LWLVLDYQSVRCVSTGLKDISTLVPSSALQVDIRLQNLFKPDRSRVRSSNSADVVSAFRSDSF